LDRVSALHHTRTFEIVYPEKFLRIGPGTYSRAYTHNMRCCNLIHTRARQQTTLYSIRRSRFCSWCINFIYKQTVNTRITRSNRHIIPVVILVICFFICRLLLFIALSTRLLPITSCCDIASLPYKQSLVEMDFENFTHSWIEVNNTVLGTIVGQKICSFSPHYYIHRPILYTCKLFPCTWMRHVEPKVCIYHKMKVLTLSP